MNELFNNISSKLNDLSNNDKKNFFFKEILKVIETGNEVIHFDKNSLKIIFDESFKKDIIQNVEKNLGKSKIKFIEDNETFIEGEGFISRITLKDKFKEIWDKEVLEISKRILKKMKLKYSDWCYLSSKSIILTDKFPKLEHYKSYLSVSPKIFIEQIKKDNDIVDETTNFEEVLKKDWENTLSFFGKKVPLKSIIEYFEIERNYYKVVNGLTDEKRLSFLKDKFENEIKLFKYSPFLVDFIRIEIDFHNIESFLKHKYFETKFFFIPNGYFLYSKFKNFEKETTENFIEFINLKYKNFIEKELLEFLTFFDKKKDEYTIKILKESKFFVFGPEIAFSYLKLKDFHYTNLNIIYNGLIYNQSSDSIIRRLRLING